jgi:hypothetical protein
VTLPDKCDWCGEVARTKTYPCRCGNRKAALKLCNDCKVYANGGECNECSDNGYERTAS